MPKERIVEMDILRGITFLAIVLQHAIGEYFYRADIQVEDAQTLGILYLFTKFGVPAFVFMTGMSLFYTYYENLSYGRYLQKRIQDIFVPFVLWTAIYLFYVASISGFVLFQHFFSELLVPKAAYHLWYIVMIFQFYLLLPFFIRLIKGAGNLKTATLFAVFLAYIGILWWYDSYLPLHLEASPDWLKPIIVERNIFFISYLAYFVIGAVAALSLSSFRSFCLRATGWMPLLFIFFFTIASYEWLVGMKTTFSLNWSTTLKPSMFFLVLSELFLVYALSLRISKEEGVLRNTLLFIGRHSFGAFLIHALLIFAWSSMFDRLPVPFPNYHYLELTLICFAAVSLLSVGATWLLAKLPFGRYLVGRGAGTKKS